MNDDLPTHRDEHDQPAQPRDHRRRDIFEAMLAAGDSRRRRRRVCVAGVCTTAVLALAGATWWIARPSTPALRSEPIAHALTPEQVPTPIVAAHTSENPPQPGPYASDPGVDGKFSAIRVSYFSTPATIPARSSSSTVAITRLDDAAFEAALDAVIMQTSGIQGFVRSGSRIYVMNNVAGPKPPF